MIKRILHFDIRTINWFDDKIVDWANAGTSYDMDGKKTQLNKYSFAFNFDSAIQSKDGRYIFIYQKLGTKGLLIKDGEILREINRSYYCANIYEYPAAFITHNGKTFLVHCPKSYCQLDFEDVETGEVVTDVERRNPSDVFHSRLEVDKNERHLASKGWVWHPLDVAQVFDIAYCFANPLLLDSGNSMDSYVGTEICTASFISSDELLVGSSDEVFDEENLVTLPPKSFAIWNFRQNKFYGQISPKFEFGNLFCIDNNLMWDLYMYPKIIDIKSGQIIDKEEGIYSGEQKSSMLFNTDKQPSIAFDENRNKLAIKDKDKIIVLERE